MKRFGEQRWFWGLRYTGSARARGLNAADASPDCCRRGGGWPPLGNVPVSVILAGVRGFGSSPSCPSWTPCLLPPLGRTEPAGVA